MLIDYIINGEVAWSDLSITDSELAKKMAEAAVRDRLAERVDIRDQNGRLLFYYPRISRAA